MSFAIGAAVKTPQRMKMTGRDENGTPVYAEASSEGIVEDVTTVNGNRHCLVNHGDGTKKWWVEDELAPAGA